MKSLGNDEMRTRRASLRLSSTCTFDNNKSSGMLQDGYQPFIDYRAFNKANTSYVPFPSQADAMLASLQLFHDVPCRIMDLVISVITHPGFDAKQVTLRSSVDVVNIVEESRLKDRMAVVHARSMSRDGRVQQAGFPHFVLFEILDIIHAERMENIKARFEEALDDKAMYSEPVNIEEDDTLKALCLVHRFWTLPAQKVLGRVLHLARPTRMMDSLISPVRKPIFGPWTSAVAIQFFAPLEAQECENDDDEHSIWIHYAGIEGVQEKYRQWFETLHRILVSFTNLRCIYVKTYFPFFAECSIITIRQMVRQNDRLEELTLYANRGLREFISGQLSTFNLDLLLENNKIFENLKSLKIQGAVFSGGVRKSKLQGLAFARLCKLFIKSTRHSLKDDMALFSVFSAHPNPHLELTMDISHPQGRDWHRSDSQFGFQASFSRVRTLHVGGRLAEKCMKFIAPHCSTLNSLTVLANVSWSPDLLKFIPTTIQSLDFRLLRGSSHTRNQNWEKTILEFLSAKHLPELKSFDLSLSKTETHPGHLSESEQLSASEALERMEDFKEELTVVCGAAGIVHSLQLLTEDQMTLPDTIRWSL